MVITILVVAGLYVAYREYTAGKLNTLVTTVEARVTALETTAKADASKVVAAVASKL